MLLNRYHKIIAFQTLSTLLLALLASCSNSSAIENLVSADPQLSENANHTENVKVEARTITPQNDRSNDSIEPETTPETQRKANLSQFPELIPVYRPAELQETKSGLTDETGKAVWRSPDAIDRIATNYQEQLKSDRWEIIQPFNLAPDIEESEAVASKKNLEITISLAQIASGNENNDNTRLTIAYKPIEAKSTSENPVTKSTPEETLSALADTAIEEESENTGNLNETPTANTPKKLAPDISKTNFADLDEVPEQLQQYVGDVAKLGILTPYTQEGSVDMNLFAPNQPITRSEYARWLIAANNEYYQDSPSQKIYETKDPEKPAFNDVNTDNPDFGAIQGLAEAGLIPSILTDDSSKLLFQPNAPLKREDLVTWKVPLDTRKALPKADVEAIQESWGFQDAANIDSTALKALFADFQNGDRSNVGRAFGYTTLFQPKKPVTRAEAAASLWYFGFQGEGISAPEITQASTSSE